MGIRYESSATLNPKFRMNNNRFVGWNIAAISFQYPQIFLIPEYWTRTHRNGANILFENLWAIPIQHLQNWYPEALTKLKREFIWRLFALIPTKHIQSHSHRRAPAYTCTFTSDPYTILCAFASPFYALFVSFVPITFVACNIHVCFFYRSLCRRHFVRSMYQNEKKNMNKKWLRLSLSHIHSTHSHAWTKEGKNNSSNDDENDDDNDNDEAREHLWARKLLYAYTQYILMYICCWIGILWDFISTRRIRFQFVSIHSPVKCSISATQIQITLHSIAKGKKKANSEQNIQKRRRKQKQRREQHFIRFFCD